MFLKNTGFAIERTSQQKDHIKALVALSASGRRQISGLFTALLAVMGLELPIDKHSNRTSGKNEEKSPKIEESTFSLRKSEA